MPEYLGPPSSTLSVIACERERDCVSQREGGELADSELHPADALERSFNVMRL